MLIERREKNIRDTIFIKNLGQSTEGECKIQRNSVKSEYIHLFHFTEELREHFSTFGEV